MEKLLESVKRLQHYKTREGVIREGLKWVGWLFKIGEGAHKFCKCDILCL